MSVLVEAEVDRVEDNVRRCKSECECEYECEEEEEEGEEEEAEGVEG